MPRVRRNDHRRGSQVPLLRCRFRSTVARHIDARWSRLPELRDAPVAPAERIKQIENCFKGWWICLAVGVGLCITCIGAVLGIPALIAGVVFHMMLLYKLWCTVQDGRAESTPGKAIGFLFIPFFDIYWQFVAIWGLSKDLNRYSREHNIAAPDAKESLALTVCILNCCSIIPYVNFLTGIAALITSIIALKGMCDTAIAIIQRENA